jgi:hypothetical protein
MSYTLTYAPGGLASAADYIRSKGRGEDTRLMHVTEGELQSLQGLAMANGGSLTINPETGLPEAGFLKNILPTAAIAGAAIFGGPALGAALLPGASTALATGVGMGLISGLGTTLMTGDINKGLTAGATSGLLGGLTGGVGAKVDPTAVATNVPAAQAAKAAAANTAVNTSLNVPGASMMTHPSIVTAGAQPVASPGLLDKASDWWSGLSGNQKLGVGLGGVGALGILGSMSQPKLKDEPIDKGTIRPYTYQSTMAAPRPGQSSVFSRGPMYNAAGNPILDTEERNYFNQSFTPQPTYKAAAGGLMQGDMYPLSQQVNTQFATPTQMPTSAEVVGADYAATTLPFSGQPVRMRSGGAAEATREEAIQSALNNTYTYDPATQQYTHVPPPPPPQPEPRTMLRNMFGGMGGKGMAGRNQPYMGMGGMNQGYQGIGGIGGMMGMLRGLERQATPVPIPSYQYTYDPVQQQYTQMAEGGNVTEGYKGYGQNNQGPMPINLLALMAPPEETQQQQPVQVLRQAAGGLSTLGGYSDGGQLLRGPGDGVSDDIPAQIGDRQPARLADGEFVIPARLVSELGNGSTDAGAKRLYAWMDSMQDVRKKTVGEDDVAKDTKAHKTLPT